MSQEAKLTGLVTIDGANATGKTFLAEQLVARYGAVVFHQTYRFRTRIFDYHTAVLRRALKLAESRLVVLDRLWMSEVAYAHVYRGGTPWPHQGRFVDRILQKGCAVQIVCAEPDRQVLIDRYHRTRSHRVDVDAERNAQVNDVYRQLLPGGQKPAERQTYLDDLAAFPGQRFDIIEHRISNDFDAVEQTCSILEERLRTLQSTQLPLASIDDNFLGHVGPRTKFVIVGDKPNAKHRWTWPFYEYGHSSLWLTTQLHHLNFDESTAIWTNINDSQSTFKRLLDHLGNAIGQIQLVALGQEAAKTLKNYGIPFLEIPHPQYARRFMSNGMKYREALTQVLQCQQALYRYSR